MKNPCSCGCGCLLLLFFMFGFVAGGAVAFYVYNRNHPEEVRAQLAESRKDWDEFKEKVDRMFDTAPEVLDDDPVEKAAGKVQEQIRENIQEIKEDF